MWLDIIGIRNKFIWNSTSSTSMRSRDQFKDYKLLYNKKKLYRYVAIIILLLAFEVSWSGSFNITKRNLLRNFLSFLVTWSWTFDNEVLDILRRNCPKKEDIFRRKRFRDAATSFQYFTRWLQSTGRLNIITTGDSVMESPSSILEKVENQSKGSASTARVSWNCSLSLESPFSRFYWGSFYSFWSEGS